MSLLKIFGPGEAAPEADEVYRSFLEKVGLVPPPLLLTSPSPFIQSLQVQLTGYYQERCGLTPLLAALIRYLTAIALEMEPCVRYNAAALTAMGLEEEKVREIGVNPAAAPLDEKDGWLLAFVVKAVRAPESVSPSHIQMLRNLGWTDTDIFDALYLSCTMVGMGRMMKALKFEVPPEGATGGQRD